MDAKKHETMASLLADGQLNNGAVRAYLWLWNEAAEEAPEETIVIKAKWAAGIAKSPRSIDRYVNALSRLGLIDVKKEWKGMLWLFIYRANPNPDRQGRLPLGFAPATETPPETPTETPTETPSFGTTQTPPANQLTATASENSTETPTELAKVPMDYIETKAQPNHLHCASMESMGSMGDGPAQIGPIVLEALRKAATADPVEMRRHREKLKAWIIQRVADPLMHESIAGRAADAVVSHGYPQERLLEIVDGTRRKAQLGEITVSPGAYFQGRCRRAGVPWPTATKTTSP